MLWLGFACGCMGCVDCDMNRVLAVIFAITVRSSSALLMYRSMMLLSFIFDMYASHFD